MKHEAEMPRAFAYYRSPGCLYDYFVILSNSTRIAKGSNRMMKKAENIYIMENIQSPGILIECGFISNFEEEALLCDENYQRKVCSVIASVTSQYLNAEREHT